MMSDIAAKLDESRALVEKGWCQRAYQRDGCYCLIGAVAVAIGGTFSDGIRTQTFDDAYGILRRAVGDQRLQKWNDAPERTQAEVIEAFRKAAELARQEQSA